MGSRPADETKSNPMPSSFRTKFGALAAAVFSWGAIGAAQAVPGGLTGTDVDIRYDYTGAPSLTSTVTVGAGVEMACDSGTGIAACGYLNVGKQSVDIDADTFTYRMAGGSATFTPLAQNGFTFSNLNPGYAIGGVTLQTNVPTMDDSRIGFSASSVSVYMAGVQVDDGSFFTLTLRPVPEPATAAMLAAGLLGVAGIARRARRG